MENTTGEQIRKWLEKSPGNPEVSRLEICDTDSLSALKITENSFIGQIVGHYSHMQLCGHIHMLCGNGDDSLAELNAVDAYGMPRLFPRALIIAYDNGGGIFAVNAGAATYAKIGNVMYLPKEGFAWEDLGIRYSGFLKWACSVTEKTLLDGAWKQEYSQVIQGRLQDFIIGKAAAYNMFLMHQKG